MLVIQADLLNSKLPPKLSWTVFLIKRFARSVMYSAREINHPGSFLIKIFWGSRFASDHTLPAWPKQLSYKSGQDKLEGNITSRVLACPGWKLELSNKHKNATQLVHKHLFRKHRNSLLHNWLSIRSLRQFISIWIVKIFNIQRATLELLDEYNLQVFHIESVRKCWFKFGDRCTRC